VYSLIMISFKACMLSYKCEVSIYEGLRVDVLTSVCSPTFIMIAIQKLQRYSV